MFFDTERVPKFAIDTCIRLLVKLSKLSSPGAAPASSTHAYMEPAIQINYRRALTKRWGRRSVWLLMSAGSLPANSLHLFNSWDVGRDISIGREGVVLDHHRGQGSILLSYLSSRLLALTNLYHTMPSIYYIKLFRELYFILIPASALVYTSTFHGCRSIYTTNLFVIAPTLAPAQSNSCSST